MGVDLTMVTEPISLPEKEPAQGKQRERERLTPSGRIKMLGSSHAWSLMLCLMLEAGLCFLEASD